MGNFPCAFQQQRPAAPPARRHRRNSWSLRAPAAAFLVGLLGLGLTQLHATTLARMDLRELARQSAYIARARCVNTTGQSSSRLIWTLSTFVVTEAWKGNPPSPFTIRLPGGEAAGRRVTVEGAPQFAVGEEVVLFLSTDTGRQMTIVSWAQGTFRIHRNPRTGAMDAVQDTAGLQVLDTRSGAWSPGERRQIPLTELRARVASALQDGAR